MYIETFKGKKGKYNKSILKALYENGSLSAWNLAKYIVRNDPKKQKRNWYHETQKVNSVLTRKSGTLDRLSENEYILRKDQNYYLTINKGFCSALTLFEKVKEPAIDDFSEAYKVIPELKEAIEIISRLHPEAMTETYRLMRTATKELLKKGLNFDTISNRQFNVFFNDQMNRISLQELKKEREKKEKSEPNPELQECALRIMERMKGILLEQIKELDKEFKSFKESKFQTLTEKKED